MANSYKALTVIKHGGVRQVKNPETGEIGAQHVINVFAPGDLVTGLSKVEMAALWEAGALEAVATVSAPVVPATPAVPDRVPAEPETGSEGESGEQTPSEPQGGDN